MNHDLRDYQEILVERALAAISLKKNPLIVIPPGSGKTHVMVAILDRFSRSLAIAHRVELTNKIKRLLPGSGHSAGTVQALQRQIDADIDILAIDEAHHAPAATYQSIIQQLDCPILGVTATPCRMDGKGLDDTFHELIEGPTAKQLTASGWLMPFDLYSTTVEIESADLAVGKDGDYRKSDAAARAMGKTITADAVAEWQSKAAGLQTIAFTCSNAHSFQVLTQYRKAGIKAAVVKSGGSDRYEIIPAFERGEFQVLINCEIAIEGIDVPSCECVQILRPTNSIRIYDQMIGRVLRLSGRRGVVLDHAHNWERLGYPFEGRIWTLKGLETIEASLKTCPVCRTVAEGDIQFCVSCGHEFGKGEESDRASRRITIPAMKRGELALVRDWHDLKIQAAELRVQGFKDHAIGKKLGVTQHAITRWLGKNPDLPDRELLKPQAVELRAQGLRDKTIGKKLGVSPDTITRWLGKNPDIPDFESLKPQAVELSAQGFAHHAISEKLGVHPNIMTRWLGKDLDLPDLESLKSQAAELRAQGLKDSAIGKKLRKRPGVITRWLGKNPDLPDFESLKPQAAELRAQGFKDHAIGKRLGVSQHAITRWLGRNPNSPKNPAYPTCHTPDNARSLVPPSSH